MNKTNRTIALASNDARTSMIQSLARLSLAALVTAASLASAVETVEMVKLVALAGTTTTAKTYATPEQSLATIQVLSGYDTSVRNQLLAVARYPNRPEARRARLQGTVAVEFKIDRQGILQDAGIVLSSHSKILDAAALANVRWAKYQAFPVELASGELDRRYKVTFDFRPPAQTE